MGQVIAIEQQCNLNKFKIMCDYLNDFYKHCFYRGFENINNEKHVLPSSENLTRTLYWIRSLQFLPTHTWWNSTVMYLIFNKNCYAQALLFCYLDVEGRTSPSLERASGYPTTPQDVARYFGVIALRQGSKLATHSWCSLYLMPSLNSRPSWSRTLYLSIAWDTFTRTNPKWELFELRGGGTKTSSIVRTFRNNWGMDTFHWTEVILDTFLAVWETANFANKSVKPEQHRVFYLSILTLSTRHLRCP